MSNAAGTCEVGLCNNWSQEVCEAPSRLRAWANDVDRVCFADSQGGSRVGDRDVNDGFFEVYVTIHRGEAGGPGGPVTPVPNTLSDAPAVYYEEEIPIEQFFAEERLRRESEGSIRLLAAQEEASVNGTQLEKRQQPGDTFQQTIRTDGPRRGFWHVLTRQRVVGGSSFNLEEGISVSVGVSASVGLGSESMNSMTASASVSVDISRTETYSRGFSIPINCPQCGIVEWHPHFLYVEGTWQPSGEIGWFQEPTGGGDFLVTCTGCAG